MIDIAKCKGVDCEKKTHCLRFTSKSNGMYQYYLEPERDFEKNFCYTYITDEEAYNEK